MIEYRSDNRSSSRWLFLAWVPTIPSPGTRQDGWWLAVKKTHEQVFIVGSIDFTFSRGSRVVTSMASDGQPVAVFNGTCDGISMADQLILDRMLKRAELFAEVGPRGVVGPFEVKL